MARLSPGTRQNMLIAIISQAERIKCQILTPENLALRA
jgi:hypothetical protein